MQNQNMAHRPNKYLLTQSQIQSHKKNYINQKCQHFWLEYTRDKHIMNVTSHITEH